ncbi:Proline-rich protein [[Actinomadura] parvosata subsp. kistnae]|uniref:Proline-rich protein n=1 Tax=[Actinomadura] parvosata subsp. kistnae TaxID=1909395 RepID=A0A1V0AEX0_9ACTN|nr:hypothetical protein [Nonomuraea sp. ATCC 55076]AQZ68709.1 hypothetical protein BKM31_51000 [Nonomuraea sp. ATCC 55076]SPL92801.1 Proline-rich protein [Actinomadura parvosata subsp. kistnae]
MTPEQYAQAVRDALADHPEREELLEDLDDHLAEIAAESDLPLENRLGPPEAYAEELASAYGERPQSGGRRRTGPRDRIRRVYAGLMGYGPYRSFARFLPELRPGWWVLRGYVLAMVLVAFAGEPALVPMTPPAWLAVIAGIWASVWFGRSNERRGGRGSGRRLLGLAAVVVNAVAGFALFVGMVAAGDALTPQPEEDQAVWMQPASSDGVYNLRPYAKDGTPLTDVYLYDQDGNPFVTNPEFYGYRVDRACGEPVLNRYPLPLVEDDGQDGQVATATACSTPAPEPMATVRPSQAPAQTRKPTQSAAPEHKD